MKLEDAILHRRSIRRFENKKINDNIIKKIINAGRWAPSNSNKQGWRFIVVNDKKIMKKIVDDGGAKHIIEAPVGILVLCNNLTDNVEYMDYIQTGSAAIQNMLLMAHSLGIGTCWICQLPRKDKLRQILKIPDNYDPIAYVAMGYPKIIPKPPSRKKKLDDIISNNIFNFKDERRENKIKLTIKRIARKLYFRFPTFFKKLTRWFVERKFVTKFNDENWSLKDVEEYWNRIPDYDEISLKTYSYFRRFTDGYKLLNLKENNNVLDVFCRTGNGADYFLKKNNIRLVCMDVSGKFLEIAKRKLKNKNVRFVKLESLDFSFKDQGLIQSYLLKPWNIYQIPRNL